MRNQIGSSEEWRKPRLGAADRLCLAAAPTFVIMALLTAALGPPTMLCSAASDAWRLDGMVPMYLLMSAFHSAPWLRLISGSFRRERGRGFRRQTGPKDKSAAASGNYAPRSLFSAELGRQAGGDRP